MKQGNGSHCTENYVKTDRQVRHGQTAMRAAEKICNYENWRLFWREKEKGKEASNKLDPQKKIENND